MTKAKFKQADLNMTMEQFLTELETLNKRIENGSDVVALRAIDRLRAIIDATETEPERLVRQLCAHSLIGPIRDENVTRFKQDMNSAVKSALDGRSIEDSVSLLEGIGSSLEEVPNDDRYGVNSEVTTESRILAHHLFNVADSILSMGPNGSTLADRLYDASSSYSDGGLYGDDERYLAIPELWERLFPILGTERSVDFLMGLHSFLQPDEGEISERPVLQSLGYQTISEFLKENEEEIGQRVFAHKQAQSIDQGTGATLVLGNDKA